MCSAFLIPSGLVKTKISPTCALFGMTIFSIGNTEVAQPPSSTHGFLAVWPPRISVPAARQQSLNFQSKMEGNKMEIVNFSYNKTHRKPDIINGMTMSSWSTVNLVEVASSINTSNGIVFLSSNFRWKFKLIIKTRKIGQILLYILDL